MSKAFRFKQFNIMDNDCPMKVGTDAILLGSWVKEKASTVLDIGTGCGILALMLAQKTNAKIDAIEINKEAALQAKYNFNQSKWSDRLQSINTSFQDYYTSTTKRYDLIISNPPFFENSLLSTQSKKNLARHNDSLPSTELINGCKKLLNNKGKLYLTLPVTESKNFMKLAMIENLYCNKTMKIYPKENKTANRCLLQFSLSKTLNNDDEKLTIRNINNTHTQDYTNLTSDYYI